jgi:hypothetical protein
MFAIISVDRKAVNVFLPKELYEALSSITNNTVRMQGRIIVSTNSIDMKIKNYSYNF